MSNRKAYWLLTTEFPPFFGGGISTYCRETVQMLSSNGYEVTVFLCDRTVSAITCSTEANIRVVRFSPYTYDQREYLGFDTLVSFSFGEVLKTFIGQEGAPFIVEAQDYNGIAYFALLYKKLLYPFFKELKIVVTVHAPSFITLPYNYVAQYKIPYFWIGEMEKFCLKAADLIIVPSHYMANELISKAPEVQLKYAQVYNPFYIPEAVRAAETAIQPGLFVFYGKASPLKGILELLRLFRDCWDSGKEVTLRLLGGTDHYYHPEGELMESVIRVKYAKYIEKKQLIIEGEIPPALLKEKIASAHAVIIPSKVDNLPYAVIECMALGKIVLASTSGGHRELIEDGVSGFLFSHDDDDSFRNRIDRILSLDALTVNAIGKKAIASVREKCNPARVFGQKEELIGKLMMIKGETGHFPFLHQLPVPGEPLKPGTGRAGGLLSVVIPFYNMGNYVDEAIGSVLNSTYENIEIIVVNDGSNDEKSIKKLQKAGEYDRVRVIHQVNKGLAVARNTGAQAAGGEFLAFLDADDKVTPDYYRKAVSILQHYDNVYFAGCWVKYFGNAQETWPCFNPEPPFVLYHNMINTSALIYKRACFLRFGQNDKAMEFGMEDYDSLLALLENGCNGVAMPEPLYHYRVRKNSMARGFTREKILYLYQLISSKHSRYFGMFSASLSNLLNANGPGFVYDNPTLDLHIHRNIRLVRKLLGTKGIQYLKQGKRLKKSIIKIYRLNKKI